jgi:hypothetical protein
MADLAKLTEDLRSAAQLAQTAADRVDDAGTCNMDGVFLRLPRVREARVIEAIEAAGLRATKWERHAWYRSGYYIGPPVRGQANKRDAAATAMYDYLRNAGWDVSHWQQMD